MVVMLSDKIKNEYSKPMSETQSLKYVHVDSVNRRAGESKSRVTVQVPQGLEKCSRVALKSFSIPNTFPNMINKSIKWIEVINTVEGGNDTWKAALFTIKFDDLDPNKQYMDNLTLQSLLQTKFTNEAQALLQKQIYQMMDALLQTAVNLPIQ